MKPYTLITNNKDLIDVELSPRKYGDITIYSIRIIDNILISVTVRVSKSGILGREQLPYKNITKPMLNYFNKILT